MAVPGKPKCAFCGVKVGSLDRVKLLDNVICTFCLEKSGFQNNPQDISKIARMTLEQVAAKKLEANPHLAQTSTRIIEDDPLADLPPMEDYDDDDYDDDDYDGEYYDQDDYDYDYDQDDNDQEYHDEDDYDYDDDYHDQEDYDDSYVENEYFDAVIVENKPVIQEVNNTTPVYEQSTFENFDEVFDNYDYNQPIFTDEPVGIVEPFVQVIAEQPEVVSQIQTPQYMKQEPIVEEQLASKTEVIQPVVTPTIPTPPSSMPKPVSPPRRFPFPFKKKTPKKVEENIVAEVQPVEVPTPVEQVANPVPQFVETPVLIEQMESVQPQPGQTLPPQPVHTLPPQPVEMPQPTIQNIEPVTLTPTPQATIPVNHQSKLEQLLAEKARLEQLLAEQAKLEQLIAEQARLEQQPPILVEEPKKVQPKTITPLKAVEVIKPEEVFEEDEPIIFDFKRIENYYNNKEEDIEKFVIILEHLDDYLKKDIDTIEEVNEITYALEKSAAYFKSHIGGLEIRLQSTKFDLVKQDLELKIAAKNNLIELIEESLYKLRKKSYKLTGEKPVRKKLIKAAQVEAVDVNVHTNATFDFEVIDAYCAGKEDNLEKFINILSGLDSYLAADVYSVSQIDEIIYSLENAVDYFIDQLLVLSEKKAKAKIDIVINDLESKISTRQSLVSLVKDYLSKLNEKMKLDGKAIVIETESDGFRVVTQEEKQQIVDLIAQNHEVLANNEKTANLDMSNPDDLGQMISVIENLYSSMNTGQVSEGENQQVEFKISLKKNLNADNSASQELEITATKNNSKRKESQEKEDLVKKLESMISSLKNDA